MDKRRMQFVSLLVIVMALLAGCFGGIVPKPVDVPDPPDPGTARWQTDDPIPVWIEGPGDNGQVTAEAVDVAKDAFAEWQHVVDDAITFIYVATKDDAKSGVVVRHDTAQATAAKGGGNSVGYCEYSFDPDTGAIMNGEVVVAYEYQSNAALLLHEVGHCIGLNHSDNANDLMYPVMGPGNTKLTEADKQMARRLYAAPRGSALPTAFTTTQFGTEPRFETDDLVTVIIP